jgi:sucrose-6-phosphate hydrolase SacC (GH32 family)
VIEDWPRPDIEAFRDHSVRRVDQGWHQAIGGRTAENGGAIFGFTSANLRDWRYDRLVLDAASSDVPDSVWECPDLFTIGDTTVLIVSLLDLTRPFSAAEPCVWYAAGEWIDGRLHARTTAPLDNGDRFYAPQSYWTDDGRRIQFGWIRTDLDPAASGASRGVMSAPRELSVDRGKVRCTPARELTRLRDKPARTLVDADATTTTIDMPRSAAVEIVLDERRVPIKRMQLIDDETGDRLDLDLAPCDSGADEAPLTLLFDHGIVEVFRNGAAATWTQLSTPLINRVRIEHAAAPGAASVTAWLLRRP